ncbi:MAG: hypothetical protein KME11_02640 [Timaviella obliquedivisa GSE-PSE-MK23-08B]|jgi:hypothetical protein|nr:hypothetical protein [Timaviella obliquedivisa GSE-PSE-MK23-08B]
MTHPEISFPPSKLLLIAALLLPLVAILMIDLGIGSSGRIPGRTETCQGAVNEGVIISREQLAEFLTISERDPRTRVEDILKSPYCQLPNLSVRAGATAERLVYPLAFDPKTWLIVLYEEDEYAGYRFLIQ